MRFDVLTLFPEILQSPLSASILGKAKEAGLIEVVVHDIRDYAEGRHRVCDDAPYGGGDGMVMKPEPLFKAIEAVRPAGAECPVILLTPQGERLNQELAGELSGLQRIVLVCGRYAGVDERVREKLIDRELSIGDYVLGGGEIPALVVIEAVSRLIPGVLGNEDSAGNDSFPARLEYPQYTRPAEYQGLTVPEVLLNGNHSLINRWRKKESLRRTLIRRPDLLEVFPPDEQELEILEELKADGGD